MGSCKAGRPERKTLPDRFTENGIEQKFWEKTDRGLNTSNGISPEMPFYAADTTLNGQKFTVIYLRNPEYDSLAFNIIKSYEPFAGSLLKIIAEQEVKGIVIDLRQNADDKSGQANFLVTNHNKQGLESGKSLSINIVFLWDENSASRVVGFMNELETSKVLNVKTVSTTSAFSRSYKQDCFNPGSPDFDE
jgi:hypothetical protein